MFDVVADLTATKSLVPASAVVAARDVKRVSRFSRFLLRRLQDLWLVTWAWGGDLRVSLFPYHPWRYALPIGAYDGQSPLQLTVHPYLTDIFELEHVEDILGAEREGTRRICPRRRRG
jgi:hypothetical protein